MCGGKINFEYLYIKEKTMSKEMRKYIDDFKSFVLNENKIKIIKKEQMTPDEKLEELDKIINKYGIVTNKGTMRRYVDYLKYKEENPDFKYPKLDDELNSKKKEINFIFIKKKG